MNQIAEHLFRLEDLRGCNVYLFETDDGPVLIDSGAAGNAERITHQVQQAGYDPSEIRTLVLTHTHLDHIGSTGELATRFGMALAAHRTEIPYIEGRTSLPAASLLQKFINWVGEKSMRRHPVGPVPRSLRDGEMLDEAGKLEVLHTPGHTPGSLCLFHRERKILFCGDLLFNAHPVTGKKGLRPSISLVTVDQEQVVESIRRIAGLETEILCPGHGEPIRQDAAGAIRAVYSEM